MRPHSPFPTRRQQQRGAALLLAMIIVTLVATLAAGMVWQQWSAIRVEAAERSRTQSGWILGGAVDWSRLILREDARTSKIDHLGEPWATPLAEARLSTFLAADRNNTADGGPEAFLSGTIADAQARYNLRNLVGDNGQAVPGEVQVLSRLCATAGLADGVARRLAAGLVSAWGAQAASAPSAPDENRALAPQRLDHLAWLGFDAATITALRPWVDVLPEKTKVNLNTAPREVLSAVLDVDRGTAERLLQVRQRKAFDTVDAARPHLPAEAKLDPARVSVASSYFEVSGRLRLDDRMLEERSLMHRRLNGNAILVVAIHRERRPQQAP